MTQIYRSSQVSKKTPADLKKANGCTYICKVYENQLNLCYQRSNH